MENTKKDFVIVLLNDYHLNTPKPMPSKMSFINKDGKTVQGLDNTDVMEEKQAREILNKFLSPEGSIKNKKDFLGKEIEVQVLVRIAKKSDLVLLQNTFK